MRTAPNPCAVSDRLIPGSFAPALTISGTYHAFNFQKNGYRYLAETQYRFNRRFDLTAILPRLLRAAVTTGKRTEIWLRLAEDER